MIVSLQWSRSISRSTIRRHISESVENIRIHRRQDIQIFRINHNTKSTRILYIENDWYARTKRPQGTDHEENQDALLDILGNPLTWWTEIWLFTYWYRSSFPKAWHISKTPTFSEKFLSNTLTIFQITIFIKIFNFWTLHEKIMTSSTVAQVSDHTR